MHKLIYDNLPNKFPNINKLVPSDNWNPSSDKSVHNFTKNFPNIKLKLKGKGYPMTRLCRYRGKVEVQLLPIRYPALEVGQINNAFPLFLGFRSDLFF
jgi:hypothetical protein